MSDAHDPARGGPADLPGHDAAGEEWFASGSPEVGFENAVSPRPAKAPVKWFVGVVLVLVGLVVLALVIGAVLALAR